MTMLQISNLTKRYGGQAALDNVDLSIAPGERVALLGHNGAGKLTLMKMVLGLLPPSSGTLTIAGYAPGSRSARDLTAYLPENIAFHPALTGREQIHHFLRLRGRSAQEADGLLAKVGLADAARRRIGTYSKGMRQRVGLAQALIGSPALMVLDEPTTGLDPVSRREFYALLDELASRGTAILMSSHALSEVEVRTDRIAILSKGRKVADGSLSKLRSGADLPLTVHIHPRQGCSPQIASVFPEARHAGEILIVDCMQADKLGILARIAALGDMIQDFDILPPSLDDIYVQISRSAA